MERTYSAGKKKKKMAAAAAAVASGKLPDGALGSRPQRKSLRNVYLDDDDFSVAPSMDQDVKSVVSVSFDDVYKRGRKVSPVCLQRGNNFLQWKRC